MNDQELLNTIKATSLRASHYMCDGNHRFSDQPGTPPRDYLLKAARIARKYGYQMGTEQLKDGLCGYTTGTMEYPANAVVVSERLSPARQFAVSAHELTHMILGHPKNTVQEKIVEYNYRTFGQEGAPDTENLQNEMACELSSIAVVRAAGMPLASTQLCYLNQRMTKGGRPLEGTVYAALLAAREISGAML